jgi:UDP-glucuronate decarboxylase
VEIPVKALAERVIAMIGSPSRLEFRPLPVDDPLQRRPDISRAKELLGWAPKVPLQKGLEATIAWFAGEGAEAPEKVRANGRAKAAANGGAPGAIAASVS